MRPRPARDELGSRQKGCGDSARREPAVAPPASPTYGATSAHDRTRLRLKHFTENAATLAASQGGVRSGCLWPEGPRAGWWGAGRRVGRRRLGAGRGQTALAAPAARRRWPLAVAPASAAAARRARDGPRPKPAPEGQGAGAIRGGRRAGRDGDRRGEGVAPGAGPRGSPGPPARAGPRRGALPRPGAPPPQPATRRAPGGAGWPRGGAATIETTGSAAAWPPRHAACPVPDVGPERILPGCPPLIPVSSRFPWI